MEDYVVRASAGNGTIRAFAAVTTQLVDKARSIHNLYPIASAALGRTLTAAAMMSVMMKGEKDTLTIQIKGNGELGGIVVAADSQANVRGYVYNPIVDLPLRADGKLDVGGAVGNEGYLSVIRDFGLKDPYIGSVPLATGEIGDDLTNYYAVSEQIPSAVALGVLVEPDNSVSQAGGFILQIMPGAEERAIAAIENSLSKFTSITSFLSNGGTPEKMLELLLGELDLNITERYPCQYKCKCSRERLEKVVLSLGKEEILDIIKEQGGAELQCHFCDLKYYFTGDELKKMVE